MSLNKSSQHLFNNTMGNETIVTFNNVTSPRRRIFCVGVDVYRSLAPTYFKVAEVCVYFTAALILFGIVGNILTLLVLRRESKSTTTFLLKCLAVGDLIYLLESTVDVYSFINVVYFDSYGGHYPLLLPYTPVIQRFISTLIAWITVLLTIERYYAVNYPLKAKIICSQKRITLMMIVITIIALAIHIPMFFEYKQFYVFDIFNCKYRWYPYQTPLVLNTAYYIGLRIVAEGCFRMIIPLIALICLNYLLIRGLKKALKIRKSSTINNSRKSENLSINITTMVIAVVTIYIICQSPYLLYVVLDILRYQNPPINIMTRLQREYFIMGLNLGSLLNAAMNFVLYVLIGKRFRVLLAGLCACAKGKGQGALASSYSAREKSTVKTTVSTVL